MTERVECPQCGKPLAPSSLRGHIRVKHPKDAGGGESGPPGPSAAGGPFAELADDPAPERAPELSKKSPKTKTTKKKGRFWGRDGAGDDVGAERAPSIVERRPKSVGKRESAADLLSMLWGGVGAGLVHSGLDIPVGRAMGFQAGVAGEVLDKAFAGTVVDRVVLQRIAGQPMQDAEDVALLIGFPLIVGMSERSEAAAVALKPVAVMAMRRMLVRMVPIIKRQQAEEQKYRDAMNELDVQLPPDIDDPVEALWGSIFAGAPEPDSPAGSNGAAADAGAHV